MSPARSPGAPTEIESVLKRISELQENAAREFEPDLSGLAGRAEGEGPLLTPEEILLDWELFERLLADVLGILEEWCGPGGLEGEGKLSFCEGERAKLLSRALEGKGALERLGMELGVDPPAFAFGARCALVPFLSAYARELEGRFDAESALQGCCPVCGGEPFMAEFDKDDGRRRLQCGPCRTRWRFPRLKCPFCANEDQGKLGFLEVEGLESYRADTCDACGRYIKALDRRKVLGPLSLELADALSPELDEAARERGYGLRLEAGTQCRESETG